MTIDKDILLYVSEEHYWESIKELENNKFKKIYEDEHTTIRVVKKGKKTYTFISRFGLKKLNEALNNICSLAV
ncbi:TPA: hypothetical protein I9089_002040 [Clostridium perfringens]|uniref:hypothetical protein n=1 Tax=Clostridium perfringens TaxID=1502 RepID=UPI001A27C430|nr:hypothetical protein [Clostridium perfringens]EGS5728217.1 hypothetical protein [Clostridium perfringens]MCX0392259.1 hypothetical protein [Clostridium perfringens]MDK0695198.1 hypothetical protein [Clostridium perfringens]HAT4301949.1 hypothetical protein [Clostridium perfringens]